MKVKEAEGEPCSVGRVRVLESKEEVWSMSGERERGRADVVGALRKAREARKEGEG